MSSFLLDSGILLGYVRDASYITPLENAHSLSAPNVLTFIPAIVKGEALAFPHKFGWGNAKTERLHTHLDKSAVIGINEEDILERYATVSAYLEGHDVSGWPSPPGAAPIGQNDMWIAATASAAELTLVTTDGHFDRLHGIFLQRIHVHPTTGALTA